MPSDTLPTAPRPQGGYRTAVAFDHLVVTAGMTPRIEGVLHHVGKVGGSVDLEEGIAAAGVAASNAVSAMAELLGSVDEIRRALRMTVYVNAVDDFTDHSKVADGASARLVELLGEERGAVVRSAVGVASLPGGACVEVELTCCR